MQVAGLYDIHGNLPALEAVLADVEREGIETIVAGGDVLWGPFQSECVRLLRSHGSLFVSGNCEREVIGAVDVSSRWCLESLSSSEREFVSTWPASVELDVEGVGRVLFCHATPRSDEEILTRLTPDADVAAALEGSDADVVVCGHTHVQQERRVPGAPALVNAGSVGLPYQGEAGAFWAILGPVVLFRRTEYDIESALDYLRASGFPSAGEIFEDSLRGAATAESATAYFESKRHGA
ncbi:MAG: metallophosphoesterase family protein [Actinobacteria bacterium]|nr:metallophosphoesterase family protein [Actinomycetota bacterium]